MEGHHPACAETGADPGPVLPRPGVRRDDQRDLAAGILDDSRAGGRATDEAILVSEKYGKKANFIHVEEFLPAVDAGDKRILLDRKSVV